MVRKPIPGSDNGAWGGILNEFLDVAHTSTGEIRNNIIDEQQLTPAVRTKLNSGGALADGSVTTAKLADTAVTDAKVASGIAQSKITNLTTDLAGKANTNHTHAIADTTNLQATLDSKANTSHTHAIADVNTLQTSLDAKAAASHTHALTDLSNVNVAGATDGQALVLQGSQWGAATISAGGGGGVTDHGALTGLSDDDHPQYLNNTRGDARYYTQAQVDTSLSSKANTSHTHAITDVTNLQTTLSGKAATAHTHAAGDITSGTIATARLGSGTADTTTYLRGDGSWAAVSSGGTPDDGSVTNAKVATNANIDQSKIANLTSDLAAKSNTNHTHTIANVTNLQSSLDAKANSTETVNLTGDQTIAGIKTFSALPVIPSGSPTAGNQVASKAYVDLVAAGGGGAVSPGVVYFDTYFAGATDSDKVTAMNTWAQSASGPTPAVVFDARQYNFTTPIKLFSGLKLIGAPVSPAREFSRSTVFNWQGGTDTSLFIFPPEGQTGQSYPSDGSPRDITVAYIQMQGGNSTHCIENFDLNLNQYSGHTLWYTQFHACGFKNFKTVWWGWGTGSSISGQTHFQSIIDTALWVSGSENSLFGDDAISFAANSASWTSTPFIRTAMQKSKIGKCMVTGRKGSSVLRIDTSAHNLLVDGLMFDAQDSDPMYGSALQIRGGDGIVITNCSFKGMASDPGNASAYGGTTYNKGWITVSGGSQISFTNNMFRRQGTNMPAVTYPIVHVASAVGDGQVKWGYNTYSNYGGSQAVAQQAAANKITALTDPTLSVTIGG